MALRERYVSQFSIIAILGSMMTAGFFIIFFILLLKKRINERPISFVLIAFDIYGNKIELNGIKTNFRNKTVAFSFAEFYTREFPLYTFDVMFRNDAEKQEILK